MCGCAYGGIIEIAYWEEYNQTCKLVHVLVHVLCTMILFYYDTYWRRIIRILDDKSAVQMLCNNIDKKM